MRYTFIIALSAFVWMMALSACTKSQPEAQQDKPLTSLENMSLHGPVQTLFESNLNLAEPERFDFFVEDFVDTRIARQALMAREGLTEADCNRSDHPCDLYYSELLEQLDMLNAADYVRPMIEYRFNERGMLMELLKYADTIACEESCQEREVFTYDDQNVEVRNDVYDPSGNVESFSAREFDERGNVTHTQYMYNREAGSSDFFYNEAGLQTEMKSYTNGQMTWYSVNTYDENNNLVLYEGVSLPGNSKYSTAYVYDEKGRQTEQRYSFCDQLQSVVLSEYDENGNCILTTNREGNGKLLSKTVTAYDDRGRDTLSMQYSEGNKEPEYIVRRFFDARGNEKDYEYIGGDGYYYHGAVFDDQDRETEYTNCSGDGVYMHVVTSYDRLGNVQESRTYKAFAPEWRLGMPVPETELVRRTVYSFDNHGNWLTQKEFYLTEEGTEVLTQMTQRRITYRK